MDRCALLGKTVALFGDAPKLGANGPLNGNRQHPGPGQLGPTGLGLPNGAVAVQLSNADEIVDDGGGCAVRRRLIRLNAAASIVQDPEK